MIDCGYVTGGKEQAVELIVGIDTVYVHDDIQLLKRKMNREILLKCINIMKFSMTKMNISRLCLKRILNWKIS